jgi:hypothetical protein
MIAITAAGTAHSVLKVLYSSVTASLVISAVFSLTVLGTIRASEMRRANRAGAAAAYATLAVCGALASAGTVAYGLILLTQKS